MSTKKWEQLIDHMLNEDQERAEQLFHEIVVEQSRAIYESLMEQDEDAVGGMMAEIEHEDEGADGMMEADDEMDMDDAAMDMGDAEADMDDADMDMDDAEADMDDADMDMDDAEADMDDADMDMDMGDEGEGEPATKDDIMNLEDKLDELMAEFESMMHSRDEGGEEEAEEEEEVMESVQLQKVASPKHGDNGANAKSPVAANAGGKGPVGSVVKPVKFSGDSESVPTSPQSPSSAAYHTKKEQHLPGAGSFKNAPNGAGKVAKGQGEAAPKPKHEDHKSKSPVAESKKTTKRVVK